MHYLTDSRLTRYGRSMLRPYLPSCYTTRRMTKGGDKEQKRTHDVIAVGSAVVDHYIRSHAFEIKKDPHAPNGFDTCFPFDSKVAVQDVQTQTGGGATNAVATFGNLKIKSAVICRTGKDIYAQMIRDDLRAHHVDDAYVQTDKELGTGQSMILLSDIGSRSILVYRGASALINKREIPWSTLHPRWFYITSLAGDLGLLSLILDRAEACGASVFWNPGNAELAKGIHKLAPLIKRVDLFDVNREEAGRLAEQPPRHLKRIIETIGHFPKMGLIVSDGPKGCYLHTRCCTWYAPPLPGKRVNTTGAGDALGSGFVAGFLKTCDLSIALKVGMLNALGVITHMGAKAGLLTEWPSEIALKRIVIKSANVHE